MKQLKKFGLLLCAFSLSCGILSGCSGTGGKRIVRIGHNQSTNHPTHIALTAFKDYINEQLGDHYVVEVYPSELLGSQTDMVQLTQTGAIDYCIASNAILETFRKNYEIFNLPYLFASAEAYHHSMDDPSITDPIFGSTKKAGFTAVTWLDAGTEEGMADYMEFAAVQMAWEAEEGIPADQSYALNSYAMAGYVAAKTFIHGLDQLDAMGLELTWENYVKAMENAPVNIPMGGSVDYAGGDRLGVVDLALNTVTLEPDADGNYALTTVSPIMSLDDVMAQVK